ncbi:SOUL heme-binding protein [Skeletonema marinoi]|uniref:SOUL heme-binding protein n=1 Tax=Skeletonema marinoi TaxID=267567 RepID=A0AAD8YGR1_9STRA|nr:SOUL heme-binding protein [Skeletonema marinoi]
MRSTAMNTFVTAVVLLLAALNSSAFVTPVRRANRGLSLSTSSSLAAAAAADTETPAESAASLSSSKDDDAKNNDRLAVLLDDSLKYNTNNSSSTLVTNLMTLRQSDPMAAESYLEDILSIVATSSNRMTLIPRLSTRLSRTARLRSMSKVLDVSTPSADQGEAANNDEADDEVAAGRRRRRALAVLLRTIDKESSSGGTTIIRQIEKMAVKDAKQEDLANRLPDGLETPKYDVVARRKAGYEIRNYEPYSVCTVEMKSSVKANDEKRTKTDAKVSMPQLSGASSFGALAGYLFGKNSQETAMKMTTPVLTTNAGMDVEDASSNGDTKEMSFVLPSNYWNEDGTARAPQPLDGSGVRLQRDEGGTRATLMFGGFANKAEVKERKAQLLTLLEGDTEFVMSDGAKITLSQYNDPFTPPWKRLNEVSVKVTSK